MEAIFSTMTDEQRINVLNSIYQKGVGTPSENLAFSADKLVYIKPFISKLQTSECTELTDRLMVREVVDQLLQDIVDEIAMSCMWAKKQTSQVAAEYGLDFWMSSSDDASIYPVKQVA